MELEPELAEYVDGLYKEHLKKAWNNDQLADVDDISGIELYIERGAGDMALVDDQAQEVRAQSVLPLGWQWSCSRSWRSTWTCGTRST
mgnify:CR=1 FL=1